MRTHFFPHPHFTWLFISPLLFTHAYICLCCIKDVIRRRSRCFPPTPPPTPRPFIFLFTPIPPELTAEKKSAGGGKICICYITFLCNDDGKRKSVCPPPTPSHICPIVRLFSLFYDCAVAALVTSPWQPLYSVCVCACVAVAPHMPSLGVCSC